jgi:hypothetical protein
MTDELMSQLICEKLRTHPRIRKAIQENGGVDWLKKCSHFSGAKTENFKAWEGEGESSRFIRCLISAYIRSE